MVSTYAYQWELFNVDWYKLSLSSLEPKCFLIIFMSISMPKKLSNKD